jgi:hypothetical protein
MAGPSEQQASALRAALGMRTPPEWDRQVQGLDRALVDGQRPELTEPEYDALLAPVIRLRLRRALMHALDDGAISAPAAAQILGYLRHAGGGQLEDLLDAARFPNLASADFAFLRAIKDRLHQDVRLLRAAAHPTE